MILSNQYCILLFTYTLNDKLWLKLQKSGNIPLTSYKKDMFYPYSEVKLLCTLSTDTNELELSNDVL